MSLFVARIIFAYLLSTRKPHCVKAYCPIFYLPKPSGYQHETQSESGLYLSLVIKDID